MALRRRSWETRKAMRLLQAASTHWAAAVMAVETAMARATRATMAKSTRWRPIMASMASPQRMGTRSWAATLTAAQTRLAATKNQ